MTTTIFDCNNKHQLTLDNGTATIDGNVITTKVNPRTNGSGFWINYNGSVISFSNLSVEQANAINEYNALRDELKAKKQVNGNKFSRPKNFVHSTDYASIDEMLADTLAPIEVVKIRSIVNARKVSKECFLREASIKLEQAQKEYNELLTAWQTANELTDAELDNQLEQLRQDCNKQFALDRVAKMSKNDLQALLLELLNK